MNCLVTYVCTCFRLALLLDLLLPLLQHVLVVRGRGVVPPGRLTLLKILTKALQIRFLENQSEHCKRYLDHLCQLP